MMEIQEQLRAYMTEKQPELLEAVRRLVAVPSTKGEAQEGAPFGEGPAAALKEAIAIGREWGLSSDSYDGYVGTFDVNGEETAVHVLCHLDVVDPGMGWDTDPYTMVEKDGVLYGRGVVDDKGPAVSAMLALRAVKELGLPMKKNVRLILGTDEESGSEDIAYYFAREPYAEYTFSPDAEFPVINIEKGFYKPIISAKWSDETALPRVTSIDGGIRINVVPPIAKAVLLGLSASEIAPIAERVSAETKVTFELAEDGSSVTITAHGENAHASTPDDGINANTGLLALLAALPLADCASTSALKGLQRLFPHGDNAGRALGIAMEDEISGALSLTLSLMTLDENGLSAQFDSRVPICGTKENCIDICEASCAAEGLSCEGGMRAPHHTPADSRFVRTLLDCYERYTGKKGECMAIGGGTYVHEIPGGVAFGPCSLDYDPRMHGANERFPVQDLITAAMIYAQVIAELCCE